MRYLSVVVFIFCIHVSLAGLNAYGIYSTEVTPQQSWFNDVNADQLADAEYVQSQVENNVDFGFGDFIKGIFYFIAAVGWGVFAIPYTLSAFGVPPPFTYYFSLPVYFMYFIAIAQFLSNRGTKGMD